MKGRELMINPFKKFRVGQDWTIVKLAEELRVLDPKSITDLEEYRYTIVTIKIHNAYGNVFPDYNGVHVMREYNEQKADLRAGVNLPTLDRVSFSKWHSGHPLYYYINYIGHTVETFATLIYLRKENFDSSELSGPNIPAIIKNALLECNMSQHDIDQLSRMTDLYNKGELPIQPKNLFHFEESA